MIAYLAGNVMKREDQAVIIQAGAVGYRVYVPNVQTLSHNNIEVWIHSHWSQENGTTLYGFSTEAEMSAFALLIEAQGVGPRVALQSLNALSAQSLVTALMHEDTKTLSSIPGIGQQKAQKIAFHLKDKARDLSHHIAMPDNSHAKALQDVRAAMMSLGYHNREIEQSLSNIAISPDDRFDTLLRKALSQLVQ